jgi:hypothetical protein
MLAIYFTLDDPIIPGLRKSLNRISACLRSQRAKSKSRNVYSGTNCNQAASEIGLQRIKKVYERATRPLNSHHPVQLLNGSRSRRLWLSGEEAGR